MAFGKKGNNNTVEKVENMKLPKWLDDLITKKWLLYAMAFVLVAGAVYMSPLGVAIAKVFASTPATSGSSGDSGTDNLLTVITATATPIVAANSAAASDTDWLKKLEADKSDPVLGYNIRTYITRGHKEVLIPTNSIPNEIRLYHQELNVFVIDLKIDSEGGMSGIIENRGSNTVKLSESSFLLILPDYSAAGVSISMLDQYDPPNSNIAPGEKKSFTTLSPQLLPQDLASMILVSPPVVVGVNK